MTNHMLGAALSLFIAWPVQAGGNGKSASVKPAALGAKPAPASMPDLPALAAPTVPALPAAASQAAPALEGIAASAAASEPAALEEAVSAPKEIEALARELNAGIKDPARSQEVLDQLFEADYSVRKENHALTSALAPLLDATGQNSLRKLRVGARFMELTYPARHYLSDHDSKLRENLKHLEIFLKTEDHREVVADLWGDQLKSRLRRMAAGFDRLAAKVVRLFPEYQGRRVFMTESEVPPIALIVLGLALFPLGLGVLSFHLGMKLEDKLFPSGRGEGLVFAGPIFTALIGGLGVAALLFSPYVFLALPALGAALTAGAAGATVLELVQRVRYDGIKGLKPSSKVRAAAFLLAHWAMGTYVAFGILHWTLAALASLLLTAGIVKIFSEGDTESLTSEYVSSWKEKAKTLKALAARPGPAKPEAGQLSLSAGAGESGGELSESDKPGAVSLPPED